MLPASPSMLAQASTPLAQRLTADWEVRTELSRALTYAVDIKRSRKLLSASMKRVKDAVEAWARDEAPAGTKVNVELLHSALRELQLDPENNRRFLAVGVAEVFPSTQRCGHPTLRKVSTSKPTGRNGPDYTANSPCCRATV